MTVARSRLRYDRLGPQRLRYVDLGLSTGFEADLLVDDQGWIQYQHLLERLVSEEPNKGAPAAPRPSPRCLPVSAAMTMDLYGHLHREHPLARQCFLGRDLLIPGGRFMTGPASKLADVPRVGGGQDLEQRGAELGPLGIGWVQGEQHLHQTAGGPRVGGGQDLEERGAGILVGESPVRGS